MAKDIERFIGISLKGYPMGYINRYNFNFRTTRSGRV